MSDAAVADAPATPPVAPEGVDVPSTPPAESPELSAPDQIQKIKERGRGVRPQAPPKTLATEINEGGQAVLNRADQKVDPGSRQYVDGDTPLVEEPPTEAGEAPAEAPEVTEVPADAAPGADATPEAASSEAPEGFVEIPLPEGHPLRARGLETLTFPKEQEEYGRWSINQASRSKDLSDERSRREEAETRLRELEAEREFYQKNMGTAISPEDRIIADDLRRAYGDAVADKYISDRLAEFGLRAQEQSAEARREAQIQAIQGEAARFKELAAYDAFVDQGEGKGPRYPGWGPEDLETAFNIYGAWMNRQQRAEYNANEWYAVADAVYAASPAGKARLESQRNANVEREADARAAEREKARLEEAARNRAENPLGTMAGSQTDRTAAPDEKELTAPEKIHKIRMRAKGLL